MNPTSQDRESKFPFSSEHNPMDNKTMYLTLAASVGVGLFVILVIYALVFGGNPLRRLDFAVFMSVVPALGTFFVLKLTRLLLSWQGIAFIYFVLFILVLLLQAVGRLIPVYS